MLVRALVTILLSQTRCYATLTSIYSHDSRVWLRVIIVHRLRGQLIST